MGATLSGDTIIDLQRPHLAAYWSSDHLAAYQAATQAYRNTGASRVVRVRHRPHERVWETWVLTTRPVEARWTEDPRTRVIA